MVEINYWTIPRLWPGGTAYILGGGFSLHGFDGRRLAGKHVIAINNAWEIYPEAEFLHFADRAWWMQYREKVSADFKGGYITTCHRSLHETAGVHIIDNTGTVEGHDRLEINQSKLSGRHGGQQAINLAFHLGVRRLVLLGFDMRVNPAPIDGVTDDCHFHTGHNRPTTVADYGWHTPVPGGPVLPGFIQTMRPVAEALAARGVEVLNATPGSALDCYPIVEIGDVL